MKQIINALFSQEHVESVIHSILKIVGTWLIANGALTAGGESQFIAGGTTLGVGMIMSFISKWEAKKSIRVSFEDSATQTRNDAFQTVSSPTISAPLPQAPKP